MSTFTFGPVKTQDLLMAPLQSFVIRKASVEIVLRRSWPMYQYLHLLWKQTVWRWFLSRTSECSHWTTGLGLVCWHLFTFVSTRLSRISRFLRNDIFQDMYIPAQTYQQGPLELKATEHWPQGQAVTGTALTPPTTNLLTFAMTTPSDLTAIQQRTDVVRASLHNRVRSDQLAGAIQCQLADLVDNAHRNQIRFTQTCLMYWALCKWKRACQTTGSARSTLPQVLPLEKAWPWRILEISRDILPVGITSILRFGWRITFLLNTTPPPQWTSQTCTFNMNRYEIVMKLWISRHHITAKVHAKSRSEIWTVEFRTIWLVLLEQARL